MSDRATVSVSQAWSYFEPRPSRNTILNWMRRGVHVGDKTVKLWSVKLGGRIYTTEAAIEKFKRECNEGGAE